MGWICLRQSPHLLKFSYCTSNKLNFWLNLSVGLTSPCYKHVNVMYE